MSAKRPWLLPLTPLYAWAGTTKNLGYDLGLLRPRRLNRPVVSIGSLSAGGAGKTPVVLMLAHLLARHGIAADILSRGYGRASTTVERVDPLGAASRFGDEPLELARAGVAVYVGAERYRAGLLAESMQPSHIHLLDDGFQHRRLARALDIVLLTAADVADRPLPAGNLREPLSSLRRTDVVILREEEAMQLAPIVQARTPAEVWTIRRNLVFAEAVPSPFAVCGIARPENFLAMLRAAGRAPIGHIPFPDHHCYTATDIDRIVAAARAAGAGGICLTEKDAVKLRPAWLQRLQAVGPVQAPHLRVELLDPNAAFQTLQRVLA